MNLFLLNLLLALAWCALFGSFTLASLLGGLAMGFAALWVAKPLFGETSYFGRILRLIWLVLFFLWELLVSSLQVAWDVVTPVQRSRPGIVRLPLDAQGEMEILVLAILISLTPGTLVLDISDDRRALFVHAMFLDDAETLRRQLKQGMERRVLEAMR